MPTSKFTKERFLACETFRIKGQRHEYKYSPSTMEPEDVSRGGIDGRWISDKGVPAYEDFKYDCNTLRVDSKGVKVYNTIMHKITYAFIRWSDMEPVTE